MVIFAGDGFGLIFGDDSSGSNIHENDDCAKVERVGIGADGLSFVVDAGLTIFGSNVFTSGSSLGSVVGIPFGVEFVVRAVVAVADRSRVDMFGSSTLGAVSLAVSPPGFEVRSA